MAGFKETWQSNRFRVWFIIVNAILIIAFLVFLYGVAKIALWLVVMTLIIGVMYLISKPINRRRNERLRVLGYAPDGSRLAEEEEEEDADDDDDDADVDATADEEQDADAGVEGPPEDDPATG